MNKITCNYSIIRFLPHPEIGEFANIGIVLYIPAYQGLVYKLLNPTQSERVTHFFKQINKSLFHDTLQIIQDELERIQKLLAQTTHIEVNLYNELIRPRQDIIRYSDNRVLLTNDPDKELTELFDYYVHHQFTQQNKYENQMIKRVRSLLQQHKLADQFKADYVGEKNKYSLYFPFVSRNSQKTIIKPIHFMQRGSKKLIDHGLVWLGKITQLKRYGYIQPENTLFAYQAPDTQNSELVEAFEEIRTQFEDTGIVMADIKQPQQITDFAIKRVPQLILS